MPITLDTLPIILAHVPVWVWILFAFLLYRGLCAMRDHTVPLGRVLILPAVFVVWGISGLVTRGGGSVPILIWSLCAAVLGPVGLLVGPRRLTVDASRRMVRRQGSPLPLMRNLALFAVQFGLGVAIVTQPTHRDMLIAIKCAISGAMAGYFLGWALAFWRRYETLGMPG